MGEESFVAEKYGGLAAQRYLQLLKTCLTRLEFGETYTPLVPTSPMKARIYDVLRRRLEPAGYALVRPATMDREKRTLGTEWPPPHDAETMVGLRRLDNLQDCVRTILEDGVPGDLVETGVWRGGASIFMRAALEAFGDRDRVVFAADSFEGLPPPDETRYSHDAGDRHWTVDVLAVSLPEVQANFARYGFLDSRVRFLVGWFEDTLPTAPIEAIAVLRLDGDMYQSTMDALRPLYPKVSPGGYVIVDDYKVVPGCKAAIDDYRREYGVTAELVDIDGSAVYWRKEAAPTLRPDHA